MNIDNIEQAVFLKNRVARTRTQIEKIDSWLAEYPNGDSDGTVSCLERRLYGLRVFEYRDGPGRNALDLTGLMVQTETLRYIRQLLVDRLDKDLELIKSL